MSAGSTEDTEAPSLETPPRPARQPYRKPTLRRLGSVRELTLGASSGFAEGAGTFVRPM